MVIRNIFYVIVPCLMTHLYRNFPLIRISVMMSTRANGSDHITFAIYGGEQRCHTYSVFSSEAKHWVCFGLDILVEIEMDQSLVGNLYRPINTNTISTDSYIECNLNRK